MGSVTHVAFGFTLIDNFGRISCECNFHLFAKKPVTVRGNELFKCGFSSRQTFYLSGQRVDIREITKIPSKTQASAG